MRSAADKTFFIFIFATTVWPSRRDVASQDSCTSSLLGSNDSKNPGRAKIIYRDKLPSLVKFQR